MRDDFGVFILSHRRPDTVATTIQALTTGGFSSGGYTGRWWIVLDDEDPTVDAYRARWGADRVLLFSKAQAAGSFDMLDNGGHDQVVVYARNVVPLLAADLGLTYYMQLDDDYTYFAHRYEDGGALRYAYAPGQIDAVLEALVDFLDDSGALCVAMAQAGDFIGGANGSWRSGVRRKAMNTFIARVDRPIEFIGRINEDVCTYVERGARGNVFFTITDIAINQRNTQEQAGGLTDIYLDFGTYVKSFYAVLVAPSCVTVSTIGMTSHRYHHRIDWSRAVPKIVPDRFRKPAA